jgi:hypothetical protein
MSDINEIKLYKTLIDATNVKDDKAFALVVKDGMQILGITNRELAQEFDMSLPSATRWRNGHAAPHVLIRKRVVEFLLNKTNKLLGEQ